MVRPRSIPEAGTWRKIGDDYIHINAIAPGGVQLIGVSRYRINEQRELESASFAESGEYVSTAAGGYWRMVNVSQSLFADRQIITRRYLQEDWQADLSPELLSVLLVEPDKQSLSGLYRFAQFFSSEGLDSGIYFLAFWKKLLQPLSTLALVVLAISFVFGPLRGDHGVSDLRCDRNRPGVHSGTAHDGAGEPHLWRQPVDGSAHASGFMCIERRVSHATGCLIAGLEK